MAPEASKWPLNDPYASDGIEGRIKPISELYIDHSTLFSDGKPVVRRQTERGELLKYFAGKLGISIPRVAGAVAYLKTLEDLYYLKSICDQYEREGKPWGKCFWGALKAR